MKVTVTVELIKEELETIRRDFQILSEIIEEKSTEFNRVSETFE